MKRALAITDLTRMQEGRVCVAGCDEDGRCIRPVLPPPGIHESSLYSRGQPIVFPFAVVEYNLRRAVPHPPHMEDWRYAARSVRFIRRLDEDRRREVLAHSLCDDVSAVFDVPILHRPGHYVRAGAGSRSMGTIRPQRVNWTTYEQAAEGKWKYRLRFTDGGGASWQLTVTDLTWRYYLDHQRTRMGFAPARIGADMTRALTKRECYLRLGLARGWEKFPDRCYIQVTGVYTFPDYLDGRTFADFAPAPL